MKYTPYTESQLKSMNLIPDGTYKFEVTEVIEHDKQGNQYTDRDGNEMVRVKLKVWDNTGKERVVFTNLFGDGRMAYRTRHFCDSIGMTAEYESGTLEFCKAEGRHGKAMIVTRKGGIKDASTGECWSDQNDIKDFVCEGNVKLAAPANSPAFFEDKIAF